MSIFSLVPSSFTPFCVIFNDAGVLSLTGAATSSMFVATKDVFCMLAAKKRLSPQNNVSREQIFLSDKAFVGTNI